MISSKLPQVGTSIFAVMSGLATEYNAINLSQGFPDFESPAELIDLVHFYMKQGKNQYAPMMGILPLRQALSQKLAQSYGYRYDPASEITITSGATEGLFSTLSAVVRPGMEVILFAPAYDSYDPVIRLYGGIPKYVNLTSPHYRVPWDQVAEAISEKTGLIVLNTPHNPTGSLWEKEDMEQLSQLVKNTEILIISDEVYEHILFDGKKHQSVILYPQLRKRSFVIFSFGKSCHATGWKVGYTTAPAPLTAELRRIHQFVTFCTPTPFQFALADFLDNQDFFSRLAPFFERKRDVFLSALEPSPFRPLPCGGTYFLLLDYSEVSREKDTDFAVWLTREGGVASIPLSAFYPEKREDKILRFCFAKEEETLKSAGKKLCQISKLL